MYKNSMMFVEAWCGFVNDSWALLFKRYFYFTFFCNFYLMELVIVFHFNMAVEQASVTGGIQSGIGYCIC